MNAGNWETLVERVMEGNCTSFLGAGAVVPALPLGSDVAREWAQTYKYPVEDDHDLARVAQYRSIHREDAMWLKEHIAKKIRALPLPDIAHPPEVHAVLARLPLAADESRAIWATLSTVIPLILSQTSPAVSPPKT